MVNNEIELIKLRAYKNLSSILARAYMLISLSVFFMLTLVLSSLWLGFFFSDIFKSFNAGFGTVAAIYIVLFGLLVLFRKALLVRPFENFMVKMYKEFVAKEEPPAADEPKNDDAPSEEAKSKPVAKLKSGS